MSQYDAIIIGSGPAGATVALVMARAGLRAIMIDREEHPRHRVGESLMPRVLQLLTELDLENVVRTLPHVDKVGGEFVLSHEEEGFIADFSKAWPLGELRAINVDREPFDAAICAEAVAAGAELRTPATVDHIETLTDGHVALVVNGEKLEGRCLVDCSGTATVVGRALGIREKIPSMRRGAFYAIATGVKRRPPPLHGLVVGVLADDGWFWTIPIDDERTSVGVVLEPHVIKEADVPPAALLQWAIARSPQMADRCKDAVFPDKNRCVGNFSYRCAPQVGPGYFLVGDAAAFVDPIFSSGVTMGMVGGQQVGEHLIAVAKGDYSYEEARRRYQKSWARTSDIFFGLSTLYYDHSFRELFLSGQNPLNVRKAMLTLLAGHAFRVPWYLRWRLVLLKLFVRLNRWLPIVRRRARQRLLDTPPRLPERRET
ncbi:MAG: NAD(P)/FAD-dependent oxidoreductase [Myxococcota bacterium]